VTDAELERMQRTFDHTIEVLTREQTRADKRTSVAVFACGLFVLGLGIAVSAMMRP
jgi:hypothetical protein